MPVTTEKFVAQVMVNKDDEFRGRIQVTCVDLTGDPEAILPVWVEPVFDWGWFVVPDVDEFVEIEIVTSTDDDESFGQSMIFEPRIHWRAKRFYHEGGDTESPIHSDFKTNYSKRRGFATPAGHILLFDDTDGKERIQLTWKQGDTLASISIDESGIVLLGEGANTPVIRGDDWKAWAEVHTHPTGTGPSGPPAQPIPSVVLSAKVKLV